MVILRNPSFDNILLPVSAASKGVEWLALSYVRNHPFVIFMKTRKTRRRVPRTFLQKSYEDSMIYSNWVVTHISDMTEANLELYDPFVGHLVAISASIQLEHTLSKNPIVAESCQRKFDRCRDYIRRVSKIWPSMLNTVSHCVCIAGS